MKRGPWFNKEAHVDSVLENILQQPAVFDTLIRKHLEGNRLALRLSEVDLSRFDHVIFPHGDSLFNANPPCLYLMDRGCTTFNAGCL
jgi:hypothetical protein